MQGNFANFRRRPERQLDKAGLGGLLHHFFACCMLAFLLNVRVVINASESLCEVEIVDLSIVIKLH